ncbi:MAG: DUF3014 domain-containing protein [Gammaproteobacteria bacterium]|nr:DUF3014 domain-containing protein [Gammaproteobacteria bacterium]
MRNQSSQWLIPLVLAAGAAVALWYYWSQINEPVTESPVELPVAIEPAEGPGPLHPVEPVSEATGRRPDLVPLPPLAESDEYLKIEIVDIFGESIEDLLAESGMIERIVATIDSLPRSHVAERIRPIGRLDSQFLVDGLDTSGMDRISPDNYRRYDVLVGLVAAADQQQIADLYRRYYPLFQKAYVELGYPDGYFNDRLVEVIDHLLETPSVPDPVAVIRPHVLYEYEDARLEALSSGQKLLLRMGNEHATTVKNALRSLREHVTAM